MLKCDNVYTSLSPIYTFSRIFAVSGLTSTRNGFEKSVFGIFYPLCCAILFVYHTSIEMRSKSKIGNKLFILMDLAQTIESILTTTICYLCAVLYRNEILHWTNDVHTHDKMVEEQFVHVGYHRSHERMRTFSMVSSWIAFLLSSHTFIIDFIGFFPTTVSIGNTNGVLTYTVPLFTSTFVILQFSGSLLVMRERFRWLNKELSVLTRNWKKSSDMIKKKRFVECSHHASRSDEYVFLDILETLRVRHYHIHSLTERLNAIFSVTSLLTILQCFLCLLLYVMFLVEGLETTTWKQTIMFRLFCVFVLFINALKLSTISYASSFLSTEAKETVMILHQIEYLSEDINDLVQLFSYQILQMKTEITACNLFTIDKSLLYKVVALLTSYLVVCLQLNI